MKNRASFDLRPPGALLAVESLNLEFAAASEQQTSALTEVTHIFPSCDLLPENLLRFYVCFSNSMQRGRALEEISLVDSEGEPVADSLYRPPVELWDRSMRCLTVLMDPGRLKRWVGPNVELGPPLAAGQKYTLQIGSGMMDLYGRPLHERFRRHFVVGDAIRKRISVERWKLRPPTMGSRRALVLEFETPLDWALLQRTIRIVAPDGSVVEGQVVVDQGETQWRFIPNSPWIAGVYGIRVGSALEDVCGNSITSEFDRPLRKSSDAARETTCSTLFFRVT